MIDLLVLKTYIEAPKNKFLSHLEKSLVLSVLVAAILDFALQREKHKADYRGLLVCCPDRVQKLISKISYLPYFSDLCKFCPNFTEDQEFHEKCEGNPIQMINSHLKIRFSGPNFTNGSILQTMSRTQSLLL